MGCRCMLTFKVFNAVYFLRKVPNTIMVARFNKRKLKYTQFQAPMDETTDASGILTTFNIPLAPI